MNEIVVYADADSQSDTTAQVIYRIKEQAPKELDLHGLVNIVDDDKSIGYMSILESIYQSREFKDYINGYLTNDQYQLFLTLSFDDFDKLTNPNYKLTALKVHNLLYKYTQQLMQICSTIDDCMTWLIDKNATTHEIEKLLEDELIINRNLTTIKIVFLMFIQEICFWK